MSLIHHPHVRRFVIAVIGAAQAQPATLALAEDAGRAIAGRGWHLLCGGGTGVMEAACRGFAKARTELGAVSIGLLPGDDAEAANPFADVVLPTGLGMARNAVIACSADGLLAVGGGAGTLSEIAFAWQMGKPIVALRPSGGWAERLAGQAVDVRRSDGIMAAETAEEATALLAPLLGGRGSV
jgi:uncharacterized protein (TIGR00725 family)